MQSFTVRVNGRPFKTFNDKQEAMKYMRDFVQWQQLEIKKLNYIDEAVMKSDLREAKEVIKHIMDKR